MDIPDSLLLTVAELCELKNIFNDRLRRKPDVVVLPVLGFWGASFSSEYIDRYVPKPTEISTEISTDTSNNQIIKHDLRTLIAYTRNELPDAEIYLSLNMAFEFLQSEYTCTYDQYGQSSSQACIVNPAVNTLIKNFVKEVVDKFNPDGIVLDLVDINPQSGDETDNSIKIHCFCYHCNEQLSVHGISKKDFIQSPNALNLVLQPTPTGMTYMSIDPNWNNPAQVIVASKSKKIYHENMKDSAERWAEKIITYARARSEVTAQAIKNIFQVIEDQQVKKAIILDNSRFEWTSGTSAIAVKGIVDQVWTQVETFTDKPPEGVELYHYMFRRARYTLDNLFNLLSNRNLIGRANVDNAIYLRIRAQVQSRVSKVIEANQLSLSGLNVARENPLISGIVGVPLDPDENELLTKLIETYAPEVNVPNNLKLKFLRDLFATNPESINFEE
ncbi:MAG: hypothetical protein HC941_02535 [Microcoleus sp. SU_5_3]|nr:hypothetical protein [Microcoleus sp. SU_5_3]